MVNSPALVSSETLTDFAPCRSTVWECCCQSSEERRSRVKARPCQKRTTSTRTNASAPNVAPRETPPDRAVPSGFCFARVASHIFPRPTNTRIKGQYVRRIGHGSNAGRQFAYKNMAPTVISTIGITNEVRREDPPSAITHLFSCYYARAGKKVQQPTINPQKEHTAATRDSQRAGDGCLC